MPRSLFVRVRVYNELPEDAADGTFKSAKGRLRSRPELVAALGSLIGRLCSTIGAFRTSTGHGRAAAVVLHLRGSSASQRSYAKGL